MAAASQHSGGQASEGQERTRVQHLAQHLEQQSQPGNNATQQAQEAAAQPEVGTLNNCMELRSSAAAQVTRLQTHRHFNVAMHCRLQRPE